MQRIPPFALIVLLETPHSSPSPARAVAWLLILALLAGWPKAALAAGEPVAPCAVGMTALPGYGDPPNARNWHHSDIDPGWSPGACIAWAREPFTVLTALAGRFNFTGTAEDLLLRFGRLSAWRGLKYWSSSEQAWKTLIVDAAALDGTQATRRRPDFTLEELRRGYDLYFLQEDNRSSDAVVYRMKVRDIGKDRLAIDVENVSAVSVFIFTAFDIGDLKSSYIFSRLSPTAWGYYSLSGAREGSALIGNHGSSYINRALAVYRYLTGVPGDQGPPLAP